MDTKLLEIFFAPLNFLDGLMAAWLPELARIGLWGFASGAAAMLVYLAVSDQASITHLKKQTRNLRMRMLKEDLAHDEVMLLMKENLLVSFRFLRKVLTPSLLAAIPVLLIALWFDSILAYTLPGSGESVSVQVVPPDSTLKFQPENRFTVEGEDVHFFPAKGAAAVRVTSHEQLVYSGKPDAGPVPVVYKQQWWSTLAGNSAGYVDPASPVQEIYWDFPRKRFLNGVPEWLATWEFSYFLSVFIIALGLKVILHIQ